jgi:hypothetical protein
MTERYVTNKDESVRMFGNGFLEKFTYVHPAVPHILYLPLIGYLLYTGYRSEESIGIVAALFVAGAIIWSLTEYVVHRFTFHVAAETEQATHQTVSSLRDDQPAIPALEGWRQVWYFIAHGVHHDFPNDSRRLVMPPGVSIPLAAAFYFLFRWLLDAHAFSVFAGFVAGYLSYDTIHYTVHHFRPRTAFGRYLKKHHFRHHYQDSDLNFGVSSPLWDAVLGTLDRREQSVAEER